MAARGSSRKTAPQADPPVLAGLPDALLPAGRALVTAVERGDETAQEAALARFLESGFSQLEQVPVCAAFLARLYEERESWLSRRVQTQELIQEMSAGQAILTCVVAGEWVMERDFVKLTRLADGMLAARLHLRAPDCLDLMLAAASSLAILKHARAMSLLNHVEECQKAGVVVDSILLEEARRRAALGSVVAAADQATREMWDRRLQQPGRDWTWSTPQERQALRDLAEWLEPAHPSAADFARVVPPAWWDLWTRQVLTAPAPMPVEPPPVESTAPAPALTPRPEPASWAGTRLTNLEEEKPIPPAWERYLRLGWFVSGGLTGMLVAMLLPGRVKPNASTAAEPAREVPKAIAIQPPETGGWLEVERARLTGELEHVGRLGAVKAAGWTENAAFLTGRTPELPAQSQMYRKLLVLLHLDPPQDPETRGMVPRLLLRRSADEETLRLWERCVENRSLMTGEIAATAREALNQPALPWTESQRARLQKLAGSTPAG